MKTFLKTFLSISITALCFSGCTPHPTQPAPQVSLLDQYKNYTNSLMYELEQLRGKPFKRNISVVLYTQEQYRSRLAGVISQLSAEEKKNANAIWVRENLLRPGMDYFAGYDSTMASMTGGFYAFGSDTIAVVTEGNANRILYADSVSIFHELVHAMQDQYFDLTLLKKNVASSDQDNSLTFVLEGEAELFSVYYEFKLITGQYPSSSSQVVTVLQMMGNQAEHMLDSLHLANQPLLVYQPFLWAYFPYGPLFINEVAQGSWSAIDPVFASLPIKTRELIFPSTYLTGRTEYLLDMSPFLSSLDSTQIVDDKDQLGYLLAYVIFREWDNYTPGRASAGLAADNIIVYHGAQDSTLRMVWYTKWDGTSSTSDFMSAYRLLVNKKRNITLAPGSYNGNKLIVNDTINRIFIEQADSTVIIMEDYLPQYLNGWLDRLHATQSYLASAPLAKRVARELAKYPRIDKTPLTNGFIRRVNLPVFH
jgi:hypothetical protein